MARKGWRKWLPDTDDVELRAGVQRAERQYRSSLRRLRQVVEREAEVTERAEAVARLRRENGLADVITRALRGT